MSSRSFAAALYRAEGPPALRCGLVVPSLESGGTEEAVAMLAAELPRHGVEVSVLCTHRGGLVADRLRLAGIRVSVADGSPRKWRAWAKATQPDVISSVHSSLQVVKTFASFAPVVETVQDMHVWFSRQEWADERAKCEYTTAIVAVSEIAARYYRRASAARAVVVIPNAADGSRVLGVPMQQARKQLGLGADDIVFVHVGRFCIQKNLVGLVDAFAELQDEDQRIKLLLVGRREEDAAYACEVEARAGALLGSGAVRILPFTADPGLALSAADAYVSNAFFEGWSLAATEALWLGRPVILSECGGSRELIGDDSSRGILVPNPGGDPATLEWPQVANPAADVTAMNRDALRSAVRSFIEEREQWASRSDDIMREAQRRWSAARIVGEHAAVLRRAAGGAAHDSVKPTPRGVLRHFWRVAGATPWQLAIPLALVLVAGAFEFGSFVLLIPLTKAVGQNSFDFLATSRAFGWIARLAPASLPGVVSRNVVLTIVMVGLIVLGRIAKLCVEYMRGLYVVARRERYRIAVSAETFTRVLSFGRQYFDRQSIGHVDAELSWSSSPIELLNAVEEVVRYVINLAVKAGVMIAVSVPLTLAFAATLPVLSWFLRFIDTRVDRIAVQAMDARRKVRSRILDILGSIPLVKVNSQEREVATSYADALDELREVEVRWDRTTSLRYPVEEAIILVTLLVVQGVVMSVTGGFTPGNLVAFGAFLLIVQQALPDYKYVSMFRLKIAEEWPRLRALARLYSDEEKFIVPSGSRPFTGLREGIEIRNLTFRYDERGVALESVSATMGAGKVTAIVGTTGAGKTTLVDLLARLYDCPAGTIFLDGIDIREYATRSLQARMGMVSQDVWLLNRSLRDNLTFGLERAIPDAELIAALDDVDLGDFFSTLRDGFDTNIGDRGVRLSGGQRQRVALARAMLRDPDILILDEATSALDSEVEQRVARAIQKRADGRTLIVIAHRLTTIRDADMILVMDDGRVVEHGTWDQLRLTGGRFARLYDAQFGNATVASPAKAGS